MEETQLESEKIWKVWKKLNLKVKRYGKYGIKVS